MPFWTYQNLAQVTAGTWLVPPPPGDANATIPAAQRDAGPILWHDTREIQPGQVYLAIAGENFDGNRFVPQAFAAGAALAIVDSREAVSDQLSAFSQNQQPVLRVDDSVKALQQLARAYRQELSSSNTSGGGGCKVIGIAGSNGKTTTRHLIHHVLTHAGKTGTQSPKSFNNHLGVPLTLLAARPTDDFVACEIGTNHPGEIDFLSEIAKPDIAVITSIGEEHLEFFKDLDGVAEEESDILKYVSDGGVAIIPGERDGEPMLPNLYVSKCPAGTEIHCLSWIINGYDGMTHMGGPRRKPISLPEQPEVLFRFSLIITDQASDGLSVNRFQFWQWSDLRSSSDLDSIKLPIPGTHNGFNAGLTILVAEQFEVGESVSVQALVEADMPNQRLTKQQFGDTANGIGLVDDSYNANPSSMREAIAMMGAYQEKNNSASVLILGDMYELGAQAQDSHRSIGQFLAPMDADYIGKKSESVSRIVLIGPMIQNAKDPIETAWTRGAKGRLFCFPEWTEDLPDQVAALLQPGDTVLLKASRGMRLERLIPAIEKRFGKAK